MKVCSCVYVCVSSCLCVYVGVCVGVNVCGCGCTKWGIGKGANSGHLASGYLSHRAVCQRWETIRPVWRRRGHPHRQPEG